MSKETDAAKSAVAAQGSETLQPAPAAAPLAPLAPQTPVRSLANIDWMKVTAPVAVRPGTEAAILQTLMDPNWENRIPADVMAVWKEHAKFDTLQYVACHPVVKLGVVILAPCLKDAEGFTLVRPDGNAAFVRLQTALLDFGLSWPKDQKVSFPAMIQETQYGCSLILDVAGKGFVQIKREPKEKKGKETK